MEVKGQLITSPTFNASAALFGEATPQVKSERLRGLLDRQRALQEALSLKLQELRKVCLQEARPGIDGLGGLVLMGWVSPFSPVEDVVLHSESSSLSESGASHDNEDPRSCFPLAERPSPPKSWDQLRAVSGGSPERRTPWKPPPSDLYGDLKSRRNSVASPTSPTRSLPRSASSFEGRSVPATPVLTRGAGPQLCKPEGLHSRQWSGSQDSQMGFPRVDPASDHRASLFAARTRRSNSSEALLVDRAAGGGAGSPPVPLAPPAPGPPVCKSSEVLYERPQPVPAFSSRTAGPLDPPRAARPSSAAPASRGAPRLPPMCGDFLLDYSLDRGLPRGIGGPGWGELLPAAEVPGPFSRRDGLLAMFPGPPPMYAADGSSPLLRSKDPHTRATRTKPCGLPLDATEGPEVHPNPLLWMPPPTRIPPAGERSGHKNLALEGLRDCTGSLACMTTLVHGVSVEGWTWNQGAGRKGHPVPLPFSSSFNHAPCLPASRCCPVPLSTSLTSLFSSLSVSCTSFPLFSVFPPCPPDSCYPFQRYYADFLYPPELSARLSDLTLEGEQSSSSDPQTPGTLV
ncbi:coiled-coil domain-containing protein 120 [Myotis lucifugus]|uniref:coiled-coil domain-containing protein 120 n=1 Tax=Myotis lucifugus TaxID=59463 RepID=UPI000CCC39F3|nr:coiled-coil domain-containing protein 120 [Myotis lucifugus]